ncbi:hypothetical protein QBC45DRAFT_338196 [Copromyces sp. CBS 386.78]|nr:hypothetical protein QBC45DRAFT_338196 [Copromyces sp. CBS 386.78]
MAHQTSESPLPKSAGSVKGVISPEEQQGRNPLERMKSANDANESNAEARSSGDFIGDDGTSPTPTRERNSPRPQQTSRSAKILPSIEVSHHQGYSESNAPSLEAMNDTTAGTIVDTIVGTIVHTIVDTIDGDSDRAISACQRATLLLTNTCFIGDRISLIVRAQDSFLFLAQ